MMLMKIVKDCAKNLNLKNVKTKEKNFLKKQKQNKIEKNNEIHILMIREHVDDAATVMIHTLTHTRSYN